MKEAVVIGGGPAGTAATLGFLKANFSVRVLEQRTRWTRRVCGSFLSAEAVRHLKWLGVWEDVMAAGAVVVPSARLISPRGREISVDFKEPGWALPRKDLESVLRRAVEGRSGRYEWGTRAVRFIKDGDHWRVLFQKKPDPRAVEIRAARVVLADGRFSLRRSAPPSAEGWFGWNALHENVPQSPGELSVFFYGGGYVGVMTFSDGTSAVCGLHYRNGEAGTWEKEIEKILERRPALADILRPARRLEEWLGVGPLPYGNFRTPKLFPEAVGDAAAVGDPFFGEGLGRALAAGRSVYESAMGNEKFKIISPLSHRRRLWAGRSLRRLLRSEILTESGLRVLSWNKTTLGKLAALAQE